MQEQSAIILIGPQGSGKGTLAEFVQLFGFYHAEVGRILRGDKRFKEYTDNGLPCPDWAVKTVIQEEIFKAGSKHIILDGAPRDRSQVGVVCNFLRGFDRVFVFLECDFICCVSRIQDRAEKAVDQKLVRVDDINTEVIHRRLNKFLLEKDHILEELQMRKENIINIDSNKTPEEVRVQFVTDVCPLIFSGVYA